MTPRIVILHCTDTPDHQPGEQGYNTVTRGDVYRWHVTENGWSDIAYHYLVLQDGTLVECRPITRQGAHTYGHNKDSVGVCYVGKSTPNTLQISSLISLANILQKSYGLGPHDWYGHNEFTKAKTCPGFSMVMFRILLQGYM